MSRIKACGNPECSASCGLGDEITFGTGELSDNGYWENGCGACARAYEIKHPEDGKCWPFDGDEPAPKIDYLAKVCRVLNEIRAAYPEMRIMQILDNAGCNIEVISDERLWDYLEEYAYGRLQLLTPK
jgi:hypothetical protein